MSGKHASPGKTRFGRGKLVALLSTMLVALTLVAPMPEQTEAAWTDSEYANMSLSAMTVPVPTSRANCVLVPGLLGLSPQVFMYWALPEGHGYSLAENAEFGYVSDGGLIPVTGALLGSVKTTGAANSYTTTMSGGLLGGLLGGKMVVAIRVADPSGWKSQWLSAEAQMGVAGADPTCQVATM